MKTFLKKSLAVFLAVIMVAGVCPLWLISFPASAAAVPTDNEVSWTAPVATLDASNELEQIVINSGTVSGTFTRGVYTYSAIDPTVNYDIPGTDLEWIYYGYGVSSKPSAWTYGMIIKPKQVGSSGAIPDNWTAYESVFEGKLGEVYILDGVTGIGANVFAGQTILKDVRLASSVKTIGARAFAGCGELYTINLEYVETIGNSAFYDGNNICSKFIGTLVDSDGNLYGGTGIATAPGAVLKSIGTYAFCDCDMLKRIYVGSGAEDNRAEIKDHAFYNVYRVEYISFANNLTFTGEHHFSYSYKINTIKFGNNVRTGRYSFYYCYNAKYLDFGTNIDIGELCFDRCQSLESSEGKDYLDLCGVNTIGAYAFRSNLKLKGLRFDATTTSIGTLAFSDCESLATANLADTSLTELSRGVFARTGLTSVIIPKNVVTIGDYAFSAYLPEGNNRVSGWYVSGWNVNGTPSRKLTSVSFETGSVCTTIGAYAFYRQYLSSVEFPATVNSYGDYAFYAAGTINEIVLPNIVSTSGGNATFASIGLTSLKVLAQNNFTCGSYAFENNLISTLEIAATGTVSLGYQSFYNNRYLEKLEINAETTTIGSYAFSCSSSYAAKVIADDQSYTLNYPTYQTLKEVSISGSKVTFGEYAFQYQMSLEQLNLLGVKDKSKLTVGYYAFGHSAQDTFFTVKDPLILTNVDGTQFIIMVKHGLAINLGNTDPENGPITKFINDYNYYRGNSYTTTLISQTYSTCTQSGRFLYQLDLIEGSDSLTGGTTFQFIIEKPILGHMYSNEVFNYANCVYGEYAEKHCLRGHVTQEFGVDADGYALVNSSGTLSTEACVESGAIVITEIENSECLNHEYYAGTLYYKENVEITATKYNALGKDLKSNFFIWYKHKTTGDFINAFAYGKLGQAEKDNYNPTYRGTMYLTVSEYNKLDEAEKAGYSSKFFGRIIGSVNSSSITVSNVGGTQGTEIFTSPFNNYVPVYIEYECYRDTHEVLTDTETYPYRVAYLPTNLKGNSDQQLVDIYLELKNLGWADPSTSLEGTKGVRNYVGIYKNNGNGVDVFKNVELNIPIEVSRVELSIESIAMTNLKQSTAVTRKHVGISNLPTGVTSFGSQPDKYYDGDDEKTFNEIAAMTTSLTGTVTYTVTYKNSVYDLVAGAANSSSVYWADGTYNTSGIDNVSDFTKVASGYSVKSIEISPDGKDAVVTLSHQFLLQTPSLDIVDAIADNVVYDKNAHGFVLTDIPASSSIEVTRWTTDDSSGIATTGTNAYHNAQTLSAPGSGLDIFKDLRNVDTYSQIATNAGIYYYQVIVTNAGYSGNNGTSYTFYVTVNIDKAALAIPQGNSYEYDGTEKTGFESDARYNISGTNTAKKASTYTVVLTLTDDNYYWLGQNESNRIANSYWTIQKMTVRVPSVDETKRTVTYNGFYQTPLILASVNTVDSSGNAKAGDYRTTQDSENPDRINVELYDGTDWQVLYQLIYGTALNKGTYTITTSKMKGFSGLLDTQNMMWPNQGNTDSSSIVNLGEWTITQGILENPTITLPNKEYDGQPYSEAPVLSGTWTMVNSNGNVFIQNTSGIVYKYYNGKTELSEMPTNVGLYTVKAEIKAKLKDDNYVLAEVSSSGYAYATGTFQITKANLTLVSAASEVNSSAEKPYTGKQQSLPDVSYLKGDQPFAVSESDIILRYYRTVSSEEDVTVTDSSGNETTVKQTVYRIDTNDAGTQTAPRFTDIGTYVYVVEIDEQCDNYQSVNQATLALVITKSEQGISVEKVNQNALPTLTKSGSNYYLDANLGDLPLELNVTGEFDKESVVSITYDGNINEPGAPVNARIEKLTEGSLLTLAFGKMTDGAVVSVHTDGTDNAGAADCTITVRISKARPNIIVSSALVGSTAAYTGNAVYTFTTNVTGTSVVSLNGVLTPLSITTVGANNNCDLLFYTDYSAAQNHDDTYTETQPVDVGTYWVVAKYKGDDNYLEYYSAPFEFAVGAAALTINGVSNVEKYYDSYAAELLGGIVVSGNGQNLTKAADSSAAVGAYWIEFYPSATETQPEATLTGWSTTAPSIKNVSSSGTYWYRVSSKNYNTETRSLTVTVNKVNVLLSADNSIVLERQYDGTDKLYNKKGFALWQATASAAIAECNGVVGHEISGVLASATLNGGANVQLEGKVTIVYQVGGQNMFDKSNYLFNGESLDNEGALTDTTTYKATVIPKELTVSGIAGIARQYDGTKLVNIDSSSITVEGFIGSEYVTYSIYDYVKGQLSSAISGDEVIAAYVNGSYNYSSDYTGMFKAVASSGTSKTNYTIKTVNFPTVTISDREVEIVTTSIPAEYTYTGNAITGYNLATLKTKAATYNTDAASVATDLASEKSKLVYKFYTTNNAGNLSGLLGTDAAPAVPTSSGIYYLQVSYAGSDEYTSAQSAIVTVTVKTSTSLSVNFDASKTKWTYDGDAHNFADMIKEVKGTTADGVITNYTAKFYSDSARTNEITAVKNVSSSGTYYYTVSTANYDDAKGEFTVKISKKNVTITKPDVATTKVYNGNLIATVTGTVVVSGAVKSEQIQATATAEYNSTEVSAATTITVTYNMTFANGADASNYTYTAGTSTRKSFTVGATAITASESFSGSITKLALTLSNITALTRTYDGTNKVDLVTSTATLNGVISADSSAVQIAYIPTTGIVTDVNYSASDKAVIVVWSSATLKGAKAGNYEVTGGNAVTVRINKAIVDFDWVGTLKAGWSGAPVELGYYNIKVWGKETPAELLASKDLNSSAISYTFYNEEGCSTAAVAGHPETAPTSQGTYYVKAVYAGSSNYESKTEIKKLVVTATGIFGAKSVITAYNRTYDGTSKAVISGAMVLSDLIENKDHKEITSSANAKIYLAPYVENAERPENSSAVWKLAYGYSANKLITTGLLTLKDAGTYTYWVKITADDHEDCDYFGENNKKITVTISKATITVGSTVEKSKTYDAKLAAKVVSSAIIGVQNGENVTLTVSAAYLNKAAGADKTIKVTYTLNFGTGADAGNYKVVAADASTLAANGNVYTATYTDGTILKKSVVINGINASGRIYDNTLSVALTGTPVSSDGLCVNDSSVTDSVTFTLLNNQVGTISSAKPGKYSASVETYVISMTGADKDNYEIVSVKSPEVTIAKKQIELSFGGKTTSGGIADIGALANKTFTNKAMVIPANESAIKTGDVTTGTNPASSAVITYTYWVNSSCTVSAVGTDGKTAPTSSGTYYVKAEVAENDYYLGASVVAKVVIGKAGLDVTATAYTGTYDGQKHVPATFVVKGIDGNVITGYTVKFYSDSDRKNEITDVKNYGDSKTYYYTISYNDYEDTKSTVTVSISRISVILSSSITTEKVYDASSSAVVSNPTISVAGNASQTALVNSEFDISAVAHYNDKNAGTGKSITVIYTIAAKSSALLENYLFKNSTLKASEDVVEITNGVITKASLVISGAIANNKTYDGKANATFKAYGSLVGVIAGDDITLVTSSASAKFSDANAANGKTVSYSGYAISGADKKNYSLSQPVNNTANIAKKNIASSAVVLGKALTYNGKEQTQSITSVKIDGLDVTYTATGNSAILAGEHTMTLTGTGNFTGTREVKYTIDKAQYNMSGITFVSTSGIYNGQDQTIVIGGTLPTGSDGIQVVVHYDGSQKNVGSHAVIATFTTSSSNYYAPASMNAVITVTKKAVTIKPNALTKVYGDADPATGYTFTAGSMVGSEALLDVEITRTTGENVGTYTYSINKTKVNAANTNYDVSVATNTLTITARPIVIEIKDQTHEYNNAEPWTNRRQTSSSSTYWTVKSGAIQNNERVKDDKGSLKVVLEKAAGINVGSTAITGTYNNKNYTVTFENGTYTITPRVITLIIGDAGEIYGDNPDMTDVTLTAMKGVNSDAIAQGEIAKIREDLAQSGTFVINASSQSTVGDYSIVASSGIYGNYNVTIQNGTYTVSKRAITITADALTKYYDDNPAPFTYKITKGMLKNGDQIVIVYSSAIARNTDVGSTAILITSVTMSNGIDKTGNYDITTVDSVYTVVPVHFSFAWSNGKGTKTTTFGETYKNSIILTNKLSGREMSTENGNAFDGTITWTIGSDAIASIDSSGLVTPKTTGVVSIYVSFADSKNYIIDTAEQHYDLAIAAAGSIIASVTPFVGTQKLTSAREEGKFELIKLVNVSISVPAAGYVLKTEYSLDNGTTWSSEVPSSAVAGTSSIMVKISDPNGEYNDFVCTVEAEIIARAKHTLTFGANSGTLTGSSSITRTDGVLLKAENFPTVERTGYTFLGWTNLSTDETRSADEWAGTEITSTMLFAAAWKLNTVTVTVGSSSVAYTGSEIEPEIEVKVGDIVLSSGIDYRIIFGSNVNAGTARFSVIGSGAFAEIRESGTFTITPISQEILMETTIRGSLTVNDRISNIAMGLKEGPVVTYTSSNSAIAAISQNGVITAVSSGSVEITVNVADTKNYKGYTYRYTVNVIDGEPEENTGSVANDEGLEPGSYIDIKVSSSALDEAIRSSGNFFSSEATLIYSGMSAEELKEIALEGAYRYTLDITLRDKNDNIVTNYKGVYTVKILLPDYLRKATNLQVVYLAADGSVEVLETSRFGDYLVFSTTHFSEYSIYSYRNINDPQVTVEISSGSVYDGTHKTPSVIVRDIIGSSSVVLTEGVDYELVYSENVYAGIGKVTVVGMGDYARFRTETFTIAKAQNEWVTSSAMEGWKYGSSAIVPVIGTAKFGTPVVRFYSDEACTQGETIVRPTGIGTWYMKVTVEGTTNYSGLEQKIPYTVSTDTNYWIVTPYITGWTYGSSAVDPIVGQSKYGTPVVWYYSSYTDETTNTGKTAARPATVGTWYMVVTVKGTDDYNSLFKKIEYKVEAANNYWVSSSSMSGWTYGSSAITPVIGTPKFGTPVVKFYSDAACTQGETTVRPTAIGTWYMKVTVDGTENYNGLVDIIAYTVSADTNIWIVEPSISGWSYGSSAVDPIIGQSKYGTPVVWFYSSYTSATVNTGKTAVRPTAAGTWYMVVTVEGAEGYNALEKVIEYTVTAGSNGWVTEPSISSWAYGQTPATPVIGVPKFGTPVVKYYSNSACTTGETNVRPTDIGTWYMKVTVAGAEGYTGLSVVKSYAVSKGTNEWYIEPAIDGWTYGSAASTPVEGVSKFGTPVIRYYTNSLCTEGETDTIIKAIGTWYMKVTVPGTAEYTSLEAVKSYTVSQFSNNKITALSIPGWTYGAKPVAPAATATYGTIVYTYAVKGTNSFTEEVPENCGQYTVKAEVLETAEYNGCTAYADFTITQRQLNESNVYGISPRTYTGFAINPTIYVYWGDTILTRGVDYDVQLSNNVQVGNANVAITFKGNYTGSANVNFAILKKTGICVDTNATGFIWSGLAQHPVISVTDEENNNILVEGVDFTVSYKNSKGEVVSAPVAAGVYTLYVNGCGNYTGSFASVVFVISKVHNNVDFAEEVISEIYSSGMKIPANKLNLSFNALRTFTSSNESVVTVDPYGELTIVGAGSAVITVYVYGDENHQDGTASYRVNIGRKSIEGLTAMGISDMIYTGKQITLEAGLRDGDKILCEGIDYVVTYVNNVETGTATVVYTGFGNYTGSFSETFEITSKTLDSSAIQVITGETYTGDALEPTVIVKDGDKVLTKDVDYVVKYVDNTNVGEATVKVEFIGNYKGEGEAHFEIAEKTNDITIDLSFRETIYNTQKQIPEISVKDGETALVEGKDYKVIIRDINGNIVENPVNAGTYTVEIIGCGNYKGLLTKQAYVIKALTTEAAFTDSIVTKNFGDNKFTNVLNITPAAEHGAVVYTSSNPAVATVDADGNVTIVGFGSAQITATIAASANTTEAVATYSVNVNPKSISSLTVSLSGNTLYTGKAVTPAVVIRDGSKLLVEGEDYTLTYVNNVNAGTASVKINYINNYSGKSEVKFTITAYENRVSVSFDKASFVFNGKTQIPGITVKDGSTKLVAGKDYTVGTFGVDGKEATAISAGTYTVVITGIGNYRGTIASAVYEIKPAAVVAKFASETITKTYGDSAFENALTISPATSAIPQYSSSNPFVATVDALGKVTIVGAGTAKIKVYIPAGHDYESASAEYTLTVSAKSISGVSGFTVDEIEKQVYTGKPITPAVTVRNGKVILLAGRDYTVDYKDNTVIGTAKVEINGIGSYAGKVEASFVIVANTNVFEIADIEAAVYNGKANEPKPEIKYAGVVLTEGVDYELSYENNTETGVATVVVKGLGAYEGLTQIANFTIKAANMASINPLNGECGILAIVANKKGFGADYRITAEHVEKTESTIKKITSDYELFASDADEEFADSTEEELRALVKSRKVLLTLDIKLMCGDYVVTEFEGVYNVKIMIPGELYGAKLIQVAYLTEDGKIELFETRVEDGYIVFDTTHFSDFMFLGKTSFWSWWWIVVICCFLCATTIVICIVITKKKKDEDEGENGEKKNGTAKQNA